MPAAHSAKPPGISAKPREGLRINSLGLDGLALNALCDRLDEEGDPHDPNFRAHTRYPWRQTAAGLTIKHPGGTEVNVRVAIRNISVGGISLLHSGYVHADSRCIVTLAALNGSEHALNARVAHCRHRGGVVHELGVAFDSPVELSEFLKPEQLVEPSQAKRIDPQALQGVLLSVDASTDDRRLLAEHLKPTRLTLIEGSTLTQVATQLDEVDPMQVRALLINAVGSGRKPADLLKEARASFACPVVFLVPDVSPRTRDLMAGAKPDAVLVKPVLQHRLFRTVAAMCGVAAS